MCWSGKAIKKGTWGCGWVQICMFCVCMAGKIPGMSCMGLGRGVGVKNDHVWVNMGADGCRRVSKHVGAECKRNRAHNNPQIAYLITCLNTETTNNQSILMENAKIRKVDTRIQGQGETPPLETVYKPNVHGESKKKPHAQPPHHTFNHRQNTKTNNNQNLIH